MTNALRMDDPFVNEKGEPNLERYKELFGFSNLGSELSKILEVNPSSIRQVHSIRLMNNDKFLEIKYIASALYSNFKDLNKCRQWLNSQRDDWFGNSPMDLIRKGQVSSVTRYLKQSLHPEGTGFNG